MLMRQSLIVALALAAAGCFPQKAPHRPVTATSLEGLKDPAAVEFLDLHDQTLATRMPGEMGAFKSLAQISLRNTGIQAAPADCLASLPALNWLDLSENKISVFPDPSLIPNLQVLYLADNALTELPPTVGSLARLTYLNLDRNQLKTLPAEIGSLQALSFLRLNNNKLESVPESIGQLKNLKRLYLKGNALSDAEKQKIRTLLPQTEIID
jgi:Leucine-rich repeat (LRR) protein